jgi:hypothetical protein
LEPRPQRERAQHHRRVPELRRVQRQREGRRRRGPQHPRPKEPRHLRDPRVRGARAQLQPHRPGEGVAVLDRRAGGRAALDLDLQRGLGDGDRAAHLGALRARVDGDSAQLDLTHELARRPAQAPLWVKGADLLPVDQQHHLREREVVARLHLDQHLAADRGARGGRAEADRRGPIQREAAAVLGGAPGEVGGADRERVRPAGERGGVQRALPGLALERVKNFIVYEHLHGVEAACVGDGGGVAQVPRGDGAVRGGVDGDGGRCAVHEERQRGLGAEALVVGGDGAQGVRALGGGVAVPGQLPGGRVERGELVLFEEDAQERDAAVVGGAQQEGDAALDGVAVGGALKGDRGGAALPLAVAGGGDEVDAGGGVAAVPGGVGGGGGDLVRPRREPRGVPGPEPGRDRQLDGRAPIDGDGDGADGVVVLGLDLDGDEAVDRLPLQRGEERAARRLGVWGQGGVGARASGAVLGAGGQREERHGERAQKPGTRHLEPPLQAPTT